MTFASYVFVSRRFAFEFTCSNRLSWLLNVNSRTDYPLFWLSWWIQLFHNLFIVRMYFGIRLIDIDSVHFNRRADVHTWLYHLLVRRLILILLFLSWKFDYWWLLRFLLLHFFVCLITQHLLLLDLDLLNLLLLDDMLIVHLFVN